MKAFTRILSLTALCVMFLCLSVSAADGETLYNSEYCFREADFTEDVPQPLEGIFVTAVPDSTLASVKLGGRTIRPGDILTAGSLEKLRLQPACSENCDAVLCYQPIYGTSLGDPAQLTIRIRSGKNETPTAADAEFETYKNIANDGKLTGSDPENAPLIFRIEQEPKRGSVELKENGSFVYTPNKNKVGEDSFTFTVTDDAGNTSQPATVKINILKPTEAMSFADLKNSNDCFEAMWLAEQGLGNGRQVGELLCFCPDETLSRGEFLVMVMELGGIAPDEGEQAVSCFTDCGESWLEGYLSSAMRCGIISGESSEKGLVFRPKDPVTGQEAAVMVQNMLKLPVPAAAYDCACESWACEAVLALSDAGISLPASDNTPLTRMEAAKLLYQAAKLS